MGEIYANCGNMLRVAVLGYLIVLLAMSIDLVCGIRKAKIRGEYTNSTALSRSVTKFITYEGGMLIATGIDCFIHLGRFWELLGIDMLLGIPIITVLVGIFICGVEWISIREKADEKTKKELKQATAVAGKVAAAMLSKDDLKEALTQAVVDAISKSQTANNGGAEQ